MVSRMAPIDPAAFAALTAAAGPGDWTTDPAAIAPHLVDWRGRVTGSSGLLLRPRSTVAVAAIVAAAAAHRVAVVAQGGNTGLVGGGIPDASGGAVVVSTARLDGLGTVDTAGLTVTVGAGAVLETVHAHVAAAGCRFPLSLAAKGSATIGGLVATNAGGTQVLRHGTMRARVVALEAVLPDGSVLPLPAALMKDTSGYDIKQLLIGAEGTLGIVTAVTLRLVRAPTQTAVAWVGLASPDAALALLGRLRDAVGDLVESFELMPAAGLALVVATGRQAPLGGDHAWHALIEVAAVAARGDLAGDLAGVLGDALVAGEIGDAVIAQSAAQAAALWQLRETLPEAERRDGFAVKHDIAVAVGAMPGFIASVTALVEAAWPGARVLAFGHLGDGNIHFNVRAPAGIDSRGWVEANGVAITRAVDDALVAAGGTIAAEHGIGSVKRAELARLADPARLAAMRAVKAALDPLGIMNPGKIL